MSHSSSIHHQMMGHEMEDEALNDGGAFSSDREEGAMGDMMKMYFHFGTGDLLLFRGLKLDSNTKLMAACLVLFLGSILHEALNYFRSFVCLCQLKKDHNNNMGDNRRLSNKQLVGCEQSVEEANGASSMPKESRGFCCATGPSLAGARYNSEGKKDIAEGQCCPFRSPDSHCFRLLQAAVQFLRTGLALTLMLAAMTYNLCLIFAIVLGAAVGSYLFQRRLSGAGSDSICH